MKKIICALILTMITLLSITSCSANSTTDAIPSYTESNTTSIISITTPDLVVTSQPVSTTSFITTASITEDLRVTNETESKNEITKEIIDNLQNEYEIAAKTTDVVNFRKAPSTDSEIIDTLNPNTQIFITDLQKTDDFYNVNINNINGYISSKFVSTEINILIATEDTTFFINNKKTEVSKGFELVAYKDTDGNYRDSDGNILNLDSTKFSEKSEYLKSILESSDKKLLTSFTTYYSLSDYYAGKAYNINLVCTEIDNVVILKDGIFDWHKVVGNTNKDEGYHLSNIYAGGQTVKGYGGGVCQMSSTIYNCVLNLNLEVLERHPHGMPVHYVDWTNGKDASVDDIGGFNFRFKNTSEYDIVIKAYTSVEPQNEIDTQGVLTVEFYGLNY